MTLADCAFVGNEASGSGGALFASEGARVDAARSTFFGNWNASDPG